MTSGRDSRARLHVVTGKGGTGKTTVSGALALALTMAGQRVLLVEVEGRQGIAALLGTDELGAQEQVLATTDTGGRLSGLAVDARASLVEYLATNYRLGRTAGVLDRIGAVEFATSIAPGVRDVLLTGKVYEAARRTGRHAGSGPSTESVYDAVVLDAPPTGRITPFLAVNREVGHLATRGPIRGQAETITHFLQDRRTVVHVVTLLEEMPVREAIEAVAELTAAGFHVGSVVVNRERDPIVTPGHLRRVRAGTDALVASVAADLDAAGVATSSELVTALLAEAVDHTARVDLESEQAALLEEVDVPVVHLPEIPEGLDAPDGELGGAGLRRLVESLPTEVTEAAG